MQELFNILNLPENSSKEDVRSVFIAWKKKQQQILSHGKPEEQKNATENITRVTALYKQFMNNSVQPANIDKVSEKSKAENLKTDTNPSIFDTETPTVTPSLKPPTPKLEIQSKKVNNEPKPQVKDTPISVTTTTDTNISRDSNSSKKLVTVLVVIVAILCASLLYLLNDKKSVAMDTANDYLETPLKLNEDSSIHSGRVIAVDVEEPSLKNKPPLDNSKSPAPLKQPEIQMEKNKLPEIPDKNIGKTEPQRAAVQTLLDFHDNITKRNFGKAYDCLSWDFQSYMSYDGWVPGFATTVSSEVSDMNIVSESNNSIVVTYVLKAVDNINGRQEVAYFNGTAKIINENGLWKIDEIKNKVR